MKNKLQILTLGSLVTFLNVNGQTPLDVAESTLKVSGMNEEVFYYGFTEGDQLIFNFEEINGKELKEIEIIELPSSSKFMDYKTKKIENKSININKSGIYKFRLANSALTGRICKFKIQRIPESDATKNFNTSVYWKTISDTTYWMEDEKYLISRDTVVIPVINHKVERVHSQTATNGMPNKSTVQITLPANTISWSYYLGVDEDAEAIFRQAEEKAQKTKSQFNAASSLTSKLAKVDPTGSAALASIALKGIAEFGVPDNADNIQYWFVNDYQNAQLFMNGNQFMMLDKGNGPLCYKKMTSPRKGSAYICLLNDNIRDGIDVHIRVSAVTVEENWGIRQIQKYKVNSWQEPYLKN